MHVARKTRSRNDMRFSFVPLAAGFPRVEWAMCTRTPTGERSNAQERNLRTVTGPR